MRWTRKTTRRSSSACSTLGSSFSDAPAAGGRVDQQRQRHLRSTSDRSVLPMGGEPSRTGCQAGARAGARPGSCRRRRRPPRAARTRGGRAAAAASRRRSPSRSAAGAPSGPGSGCRPGAGPGRPRRAPGAPPLCATRSKWSSGNGSAPRPADLEGDPALGVEADPGRRRRDRLRGAIDAAHPGARELAGEEEGAVAVAAADLEDPLGLRDAGVQHRGGQRGSSVGPAHEPIIPGPRRRRSSRVRADGGNPGEPDRRWIILAVFAVVAAVIVGAILIVAAAAATAAARSRRAPGLQAGRTPKPKHVSLQGAEAGRRSRAKKPTAEVETSCGNFDDRARHQAGAEDRQLLRLPLRRRLLRRPRPSTGSSPNS